MTMTTTFLPSLDRATQLTFQADKLLGRLRSRLMNSDETTSEFDRIQRAFTSAGQRFIRRTLWMREMDNRVSGRSVSVLCDICATHEVGSVASLRAFGWYIDEQHALCLECNKAI